MKNTEKLEKVSISLLKTAKICEKKVYFEKTLPKQKFVSVGQFIGRVFHKVLENYFKLKTENMKDLNKKEFRALFEELWLKDAKEYDWKDSLELSKAKLKCENYLSVYYDNRLFLLYAKSIDNVERFFTFKAQNGGEEILFSGKIDLITLDGETAIDHKTGQRDWTEYEVENEPQAHIYSFALNYFGYSIKRFVYNICTQKKFYYHEVIPDEKKFLKWVNYAFELKRHYPENLFEAKNQSICERCEYFDYCKKI